MQNDILLKRLQDFEFLRGLDHETIEALALRAPAPQGRHVGLHPGLVDEDQPVRIDPGLYRAPTLAPPYNIRTQPLIGDGCFF